ncbi:MAG: hypothetical protein AUK23_10730 [Deltaproteobacteria bacterium CG2_30_43_15]|nr:MAG: hypothetical protein AUK23_10730 [Deltaproteobacteria bacterium CG2_30_43_15]
MITVSFQYNPLHVQKVKSIEGYKWHPDEKYWSLTSSDGTLEKILKAFEDAEIHLDPALKINIPTHVIARHPEQSEGTSKQSQNERLVQTFSAHDFEDLRRELVSRKYSNKTVKVYIYYNRDLLNWNKPVKRQESRRMSRCIHSGIASRLIYWKAGQT